MPVQVIPCAYTGFFCAYFLCLFFSDFNSLFFRKKLPLQTSNCPGQTNKRNKVEGKVLSKEKKRNANQNEKVLPEVTEGIISSVAEIDKQKVPQSEKKKKKLK